MKNNRLKKLINAMHLLKHENYLNHESLDLIFTNSFFPDVVLEFAQSFIMLKDNKLSSQWIKIVHESPQPLPISFCIIALHNAKVLTKELIFKIIQVKSIYIFYHILKKLSYLQIITEETIENTIKLINFLGPESYKKLSSLKNVSISFFNDIFSILLHPDWHREAKLKKTSEILVDEKYVKKIGFSINQAESAHLSSIQNSFAKVVKKFVTTYSESLSEDNFIKNFELIETELETYNLTNPLKYLAAKRALKGIIQDPTFIDSDSGLNLKQILVLLWSGIQDKERRKGSLVEAKNQLFEGLYEIQRGGNINAQGQDNGLRDDPICYKGAVHKLVEKLVGIHSYLEFIYITPELASLKFPIVVKEEATHYLQSLDPEVVFLNYDRFKEGGVSTIWKHIEPKVRERMLEEFGSLYITSTTSANAVHTAFEELLANHIYLNLDDNLLIDIKAAYTLKTMESSLATGFTCGENIQTSSRQKRATLPCSEETEKKANVSVRANTPCI